MMSTPLNNHKKEVVATRHKSRAAGISMVLIGATLWGISGSAAQILFQRYAITPAWLVAFRMTVSGLLLLGLCQLRKPTRLATFNIWKQPREACQLIIYSFLGLLSVQYSYFSSIQYGNAATATLLQYLGPVLLVLFTAWQAKRFPTRREILSVVIAVMGCALLATNGNLHGLTISPQALGWGLVSAVSLAFYTMYPKRLIQTHGSLPVVGWAMFIGGIGTFATKPKWSGHLGQSIEVYLLIGFVVLFGTLLAFCLYLESLKYLSPAETSIAGCAEPLSAALVALIFLHVHLGVAGGVGGLCIIATVIILTKKAPVAK